MAKEFVTRRGLISLGSITLPLVQVNSNYSVLESDYAVEVTSGSVTITLPNPSGIEGKIYQIKNSGNEVAVKRTFSFCDLVPSDYTLGSIRCCI